MFCIHGSTATLHCRSGEDFYEAVGYCRVIRGSWRPGHEVSSVLRRKQRHRSRNHWNFSRLLLSSKSAAAGQDAWSAPSLLICIVCSMAQFVLRRWCVLMAQMYPGRRAVHASCLVDNTVSEAWGRVDGSEGAGDGCRDIVALPSTPV